MLNLICQVKMFYEDKILNYFQENRQLSAFECIEDYKKALTSLYELKEHYNKLTNGCLGVENGDK